MTANHVLLHTLKFVNLSANSSFVEHLGGFLERCGRHEALGLESCTGDTLKNLGRCGSYGIAHLHEAEVLTLEL